MGRFSYSYPLNGGTATVNLSGTADWTGTGRAGGRHRSVRVRWRLRPDPGLQAPHDDRRPDGDLVGVPPRDVPRGFRPCRGGGRRARGELHDGPRTRASSSRSPAASSRWSARCSPLARCWPRVRWPRPKHRPHRRSPSRPRHRSDTLSLHVGGEGPTRIRGGPAPDSTSGAVVCTSPVVMPRRSPVSTERPCTRTTWSVSRNRRSRSGRRSTAPGSTAGSGWRSKHNTNLGCCGSSAGPGEPGSRDSVGMEVLAPRGGAGDRAWVARGRDQPHRHEPLGVRPRHDPAHPGVHLNVDLLSQIDRAGLSSARSLDRYPRQPSGGRRVRRRRSYAVLGPRPTKFGIFPERLVDALAIARKHDLTIDTVHFHVGDGYLTMGSRLSTRSFVGSPRWCGACRQRDVRSLR